jgi:mono/diheme cytochrome c family protein
MMTRGRWPIALLLGFALVACQKQSTDGAKTGTGDAEHGKQVFATTCATCHAMDGTGIKGLGKTLVGSEFVRKSSDDQLVEMITRGRDAKDPLNTTGVAMPPNGGNAALTDKDLRDVVAFVRTLNNG